MAKHQLTNRRMQELTAAARNYFGRYWALKILLFPLYVLFSVIHYPYLASYYRRQISKLASGQQLFFQSREEYGAILEILYYLHCWTRERNGAALVVFNPQFALVRRLARHICPSVNIVTPRALISEFVQKIFGVFLRRHTFSRLYQNSLKHFPDAIYIYEIGEGRKWPYVKYLDEVYRNRPHDSQFWEAYVQTRSLFDCRFDVTQDFFELARRNNGITPLPGIQCLLEQLEISGQYAVINLNPKDYSNDSQNVRRIVHFERYEVLIDHLIEKGFFVVLQGKNEQPQLRKRKGFVDYAHCALQSIENDLLLIGACSFYVSSKTGAEWYGLICDRPVLGLNYTELTSMQPNTRFRFFPKRIKDDTGKYLSWREVLAHPVYFQLGRSTPTRERYEFVEMEEKELIAAADEFLHLLPRERDEWLDYSPKQAEFKQRLHPGHMDLYYISGVPCDAYLEESTHGCAK